MSDPRAMTFLDIEAELNDWWLERRAFVRGMTLTLLSGLNFYAKGDPGTGKTELVKDFLTRIVDARYFETAMRKQATADTLVGPYDPIAFDRGEYVRMSDGYIQTADVALVDEAGKMNAPTGHYLLGIANPVNRIFHEVKAGLSVQSVPMLAMFCCTNEPLVTESEDGSALYDRLSVKVVADYIAEDGNFEAMMARADEPAKRTTITLAEVKECMAAVRDVEVTPEALSALSVLRRKVRGEPGFNVSDRTWRLSLRLLRASAWLAGRDQVLQEDLEVLEYVIWTTEDQIASARELAWTAAIPELGEVIEIADTVRGIGAEIDGLEGKSLTERTEYGTEVTTKVRKIRRDIARLRRDVGQKSLAAATKLDEVEQVVDNIEVRVKVDCLDWTEDKARRWVAMEKGDAA
jgi:MoxR-like ATPase